MTRVRSVAAGVLALALIGLAAACTPPVPVTNNVTFKADQVTVNNSQDETCVLGICANRSDEPYILNVAFRVKIGQPGSAQAFVVKGDANGSIGAGSTHVSAGNEQAAVNFNGVQSIDILDALQPGASLEIFGVYTWSAEEDNINSLSTGAGGIATIIKDALNRTVAPASIPSSAQALVDLVLDVVLDNITAVLKTVVSNIPCLGLCDDVLGGAVYLGIGVGGTLGDLVNQVIGSVTFPNVAIPIIDVPPDINGGGLFTLTGGKTFTQSFSGADGQHTWKFSTSVS